MKTLDFCDYLVEPQRDLEIWTVLDSHLLDVSIRTQQLPVEIIEVVVDDSLLSKKRRKTPRHVDRRKFFPKGKKSRSETGYRGVRYSTNGCRFRASLSYDKRSINIGTYDRAEDAAMEYDKCYIAVNRGVVERNRLNFPEKWPEFVIRSEDYSNGSSPMKHALDSQMNAGLLAIITTLSPRLFKFCNSVCIPSAKLINTDDIREPHARKRRRVC